MLQVWNDHDSNDPSGCNRCLVWESERLLPGRTSSAVNLSQRVYWDNQAWWTPAKTDTSRSHQNISNRLVQLSDFKPIRTDPSRHGEIVDAREVFLELEQLLEVLHLDEGAVQLHDHLRNIRERSWNRREASRDHPLCMYIYICIFFL